MPPRFTVSRWFAAVPGNVSTSDVDDVDGVIGVVQLTMSVPVALVSALNLDALAGMTLLVVDATVDPSLSAPFQVGVTVAVDGSLSTSVFSAASAEAARSAISTSFVVIAGGRELHLSYYASPEYVDARRAFSIVAGAIALSVITIAAMTGA